MNSTDEADATVQSSLQASDEAVETNNTGVKILVDKFKTQHRRITGLEQGKSGGSSAASASTAPPSVRAGQAQNRGGFQNFRILDLTGFQVTRPRGKHLSMSLQSILRSL